MKMLLNGFNLFLSNKKRFLWVKCANLAPNSDERQVGATPRAIVCDGIFPVPPMRTLLLRSQSARSNTQNPCFWGSFQLMWLTGHNRSSQGYSLSNQIRAIRWKWGWFLKLHADTDIDFGAKKFPFQEFLGL